MIIRRKKQARLALVSCLLLGAAMTANAVDIWDAAGGDGSGGTDNELIHGSDQVHDLESLGGVQDEDYLALGGRLRPAPQFNALPVDVRGIKTERLSEDQLVAIASPRHKLAKTYWAQVEGVPTEAALEALSAGVDLGLIDPFPKRLWRDIQISGYLRHRIALLGGMNQPNCFLLELRRVEPACLAHLRPLSSNLIA